MSTLNTNNNRYTGTSLSNMLIVAFVVLKLCNVIDWSWWWVLSPAWIGLTLVTFAVIIAAINEDKREY